MAAAELTTFRVPAVNLRVNAEGRLRFRIVMKNGVSSSHEKQYRFFRFFKKIKEITIKINDFGSKSMFF